MKRGDMPASPVTLQPGEVWSETEDHANGMTIRERMAMAAMQGLLASEAQYNNTEEMARDATKSADALLAELERTGGGEDE